MENEQDNQAGPELPVTITVRMNVALSVRAARNAGGEVDIVSVQRYLGLPDAREILEALDGDGELDQLDEAYVAAGGPE